MVFHIFILESISILKIVYVIILPPFVLLAIYEAKKDNNYVIQFSSWCIISNIGRHIFSCLLIGIDLVQYPGIRIRYCTKCIFVQLF